MCMEVLAEKMHREVWTSMATEVKVPTTGNAGEPAVVLEWNVSVGDAVSAGDVVATLETAKATVEVDVPEDGVVLELRFAEGDEAPEHDVLMVLGGPGEFVAAPKPRPAGATESEQAGAVATRSEADAAATGAGETDAAHKPGGTTRGSGRLSISPRARRLAGERNIDIAAITGTGPFGRIVIADIEAATNAQSGTNTEAHAGAGTEVQTGTARSGSAPSTSHPAPTVPAPAFRNEPSRVPVRGARKVTAQRMHASLANTAQVTLTRYAKADALLAFAGRLKEATDARGAARIGINDLLMFATARTVARHPAANSWFEWDGILQFDHVDLGFAVDTGSALLVPVIRGAQSLTLADLAGKARAAIDRARTGKTDLAEMEGGTFTVSNLGSTGVHWFTPVLNTPQTCILGIGAVHQVIPDAPAELPLSLTFDHRAIDGMAAATLLADIAASIEYIDTLAAY